MATLTWSHAKMVEELLERFSAILSDVCACLMGFKDLFWRGLNS